MEKAKVLLFTSPTCPHCPAAKRFLEEFSQEREDCTFEHVSTATSEGQRKAQHYHVRGVPTFIIQGPGYPQPIGQTGSPSRSHMNRLCDLALGKIREQDLKPPTFGDRVKSLFNR